MRTMALACLATMLLATACSNDATPPADRAPVAPEAQAAPPADTAEQQRLREVVDAYFEENLELNPVFATYLGDHRFDDRFSNNIGPEYLRQSLALEEKYLNEARKIDPAALSGQYLLSYEIFVRAREDAIEGFAYPSQLTPVSQFFSLPNFFAVMGSGASVQPFATVADYDNFLKRIAGFGEWMAQAQVNMREGMELGVTQPRIVMERTLPQLAAHVVDNAEDSVFYTPIDQLPEDMAAADRERLTEAYTAAIRDTIIPAYRDLHDFIRDEYLPAARESVGLSEVPDGAAWYAYLVRTTTSTDLTPDEIHAIGLSEVERIHVEMDAVMESVGFEGTRREFFDFLNAESEFYYEDRESLLEGYRALRERVHAAAGDLFSGFPEADYEIRAVEPFREKSAAGGSYMGASPDGSRPGVFYVNAYDLSARPKWAMESLFLHEAVPGHHFQGSMQNELTDLPKFRRFGGYTAYSEGWGLYAESLGKEMGMYEDPYQYFGALQAELWRALRLVVDTGLHHKGWTREQVLEYMYENTAVKEARAVAEAERYIAAPSQALAYKVGQLEIAAMRQRAETALGERFDVKAFHDEILQDGALPLDVLEAKIDRWIASQI